MNYPHKDLDAAPILEPSYLKTVARSYYDKTTGTIVRFSITLPEFTYANPYRKPDPEYKRIFEKILEELENNKREIND